MDLLFFFCHVFAMPLYASVYDQESIQSSTTPDPGHQWESDKLTVRHHKREPRGQPFPAGDHKAHTNRRAQRYSKHKTEKHIRSTTEVAPWNGQ